MASSKLDIAVSRILFERGIELSGASNSLKLAVDGLSLAQIFETVRTTYGVRPVLLAETFHSFNGTTQELYWVLTLDGLDKLDLRLTSLDLPQGLPEAKSLCLFRPAANVRYAAGAMLYHCRQLALLYARICLAFVRIQQIMPTESDYALFGGQREAYYEAEALITSARRTYDALRYILWKSFGPAEKDTPSNFIKAVRACKRIPKRLQSSLEDSWAAYGVKMTAYRDCIHHYVPVTFSESASLERVAGGIWTVRLRLPDNPEKKSQLGFEFAGNVDALTYCWELANEVIRVATEVFVSVASQ